MNYLTELETEKWLDENCVTPKTYDSFDRPPCYIRFRAPTTDSAIKAVFQFLGKNHGDANDFLVHITDWSGHTSEQMLEIESLRSPAEERPLIEWPGHLFSNFEREAAIQLPGMVTRFGWSSCVYFLDDSATIYNWEGELYDFWSRDDARLVKLTKTVVDLGLEVTCAG